MAYQTGVQTLTTLNGTERIVADNGNEPLKVVTTSVIDSFNSVNQQAYQTNTATTNATLTTANVMGGVGGSDYIFLLMSGTLGSGQTITTPTAAALIAAFNVPQVNQTWVLRVINASGGNFSWTLAGGTGVTPAGTLTIAQNTWRDFLFVITAMATPTITVQAVGTGTNS